MAITEDIHARCRLCAAEAAALLTGMTVDHKIDPITVQARRAAADIASDAVYTSLNHAFITPIDREDLWLMHQAAEHIWRASEDVAMLLYQCAQLLPSACEPVIHATAACCTTVLHIIEAFPAIDTIAQHTRVLHEAQRICHTTIRNHFADTTAKQVCKGAHRVIATCERLLDILRYIAIKNT